MKISVIIPVYNVEKYLRRCLESIINQTYRDLEIIIIDDGSTDHSKKICEEFEKKDKRILLIKQENGGLSKARNTGINYAGGDYITFVDSDDFINKNMINVMQKLAKENDADIVCVNMLNVDDRFDERFLYETENSYKVYKKNCADMLFERKVFNYSPAKLYKKELFSDIRFPEGHVYEDVATSYLLFDRCRIFVKSEYNYYYYYKRPGSIVFSRRKSHVSDMIKNIKEMKKYKIRSSSRFFNYYILTNIYGALSILCKISDISTEDFMIMKEDLLREGVSIHLSKIPIKSFFLKDFYKVILVKLKAADYFIKFFHHFRFRGV